MMRFITTQYRIIAIATLVYVTLFNLPFFKRFYEANTQSLAVMVSGILFLWAVHFLFFSLVAGRWVTRPFLILGFLAGAASCYFSTVYGVVVDIDMLKNTLQTDLAEASGLLNGTLFLVLLLGGVAPSIVVMKLKIPIQSFGRELRSKLVCTTIALLLAVVAVVPFSANYATFFREYKSVRYFSTPITPIYSLIKLAADGVKENFSTPVGLSRTVFDDTTMTELEDRHELIVMIVGETVRADHLGLNGYERQTTPRLAHMPHIVSFTNFTSCGTATAISVPCMFSPYDREKYADGDIYSAENVLDIISRRGTAVLWRDNNSSSKGVADRMDYQSYRSSDVNSVCDPECRDKGMLIGLDDYIAAHPNQDVLIVLHAMGSHGPEYFKRYPPEFAHFQPTCQTNNLSLCSEEELRNSYDNTILYADSFIADTIEFLKGYADYETALIYVSDHGESLGENGIYLHGLPYNFAPNAQKHVAALAWLPPNSDFDFQKTSTNSGAPLSHDDLYCSLLAMFEVKTQSCEDMAPLLVKEGE